MSSKTQVWKRSSDAAHFVRSSRKALSLSQPQYGALIGKSSAIVRKWESGAPVPMADLLALSLVIFFLTPSAPFDHKEWFDRLEKESQKPDFCMADIEVLASTLAERGGSENAG